MDGHAEYNGWSARVRPLHLKAMVYLTDMRRIASVQRQSRNAF